MKRFINNFVTKIGDCELGENRLTWARLWIVTKGQVLFISWLLMLLIDLVDWVVLLRDQRSQTAHQMWLKCDLKSGHSHHVVMGSDLDLAYDL